ncbi:DRTGG domain-containing protein [Chloroflexota bacterium]
MVALYVTSFASGNGKTAFCSGLGRYFLDSGRKVGFLKPTFAGALLGGGTDRDAELMKIILTLEESVEDICPVFTDLNNLVVGIKGAYARVSQGKDVVIIEGPPEKGVVGALGVKSVMVEGYSQELVRGIDRAKDMGEYLLGVVLNKVPSSRLGYVRGEIATQFSRAGVNILGILPEDRVLCSLAVDELTRHIQGELLSGAGKSMELVENIMLGAMSVDSGIYYFGRKANKAVVIKSERSDAQLAALETSISCLVLVGDTAPKPVVLQQAEDKSIPVILAKGDIATVAINIERALSTTSFNREKMPRFIEIMGQNFNFEALDNGLWFG